MNFFMLVIYIVAFIIERDSRSRVMTNLCARNADRVRVRSVIVMPATGIDSTMDIASTPHDPARLPPSERINEMYCVNPDATALVMSRSADGMTARIAHIKKKPYRPDFTLACMMRLWAILFITDSHILASRGDNRFIMALCRRTVYEVFMAFGAEGAF